MSLKPTNWISNLVKESSQKKETKDSQKEGSLTEKELKQVKEEMEGNLKEGKAPGDHSLEDYQKSINTWKNNLKKDLKSYIAQFEEYLEGLEQDFPVGEPKLDILKHNLRWYLDKLTELIKD